MVHVVRGWVLVLGLFVGSSAFGWDLESCARWLLSARTTAATATAPEIVTPFAGKAVVLVDPYSSGNLLAPELARYGVLPVSVMSSNRFPKDILASFRPGQFSWWDRYLHRDDETTLRKLGRYDVAYVLPGSETGVLLADRLAERMGLLGNGTALSLERRRKYEQQKRLRDRGIESIRQFESNNLDEILEKARGLGHIVVMKPVMSAGTDGVFFTRTDEERREAFHAIMSQRNAYGQLNDVVLVQEYLDGPEYLIDTVSLDGQMVITDAALYHKTEANGSPAVYLNARFVGYEELERYGIPEYLKTVHEATGLLHGPGHPEVKIVMRNGRPTPVLVEMGARLAGGGFPLLAQIATGGAGQLRVWMEMLFEREKFLARVGKPYRTQAASMVCLIARKSGKLIRYKYLTQIEALPSFREWRPRVKPGKHLPLTTSFLDLPGIVWLVHESEQQVTDDENELRRLEARPDFYEVQ